MKVIKLCWLLSILFFISSCTFGNKDVPLNNPSNETTIFYSNSPNSQNETTKNQVENFFSKKINNSNLNVVYIPNILLEKANFEFLECKNIDTIIHLKYNNIINSSNSNITYSNIEIQIDFLDGDFNELINDFASETSSKTSYSKYTINNTTMHFFYDSLNNGIGLHGIYRIENTESYCYFQCV